MITTLSKKELCILLKITPQTLRTWLNKRYFNDLEKLGYQKTQKILLPEQVKYLTGTLDFDTNDLKK